MGSTDDKTSNESNETLDQNWCPICKTFTTDRALTNTCAHEFCLDCLKQWSTDHNSCPVCRQTYNYIVYKCGDNDAILEIPVRQPIDRLLATMNNMILELEELFVERLVQLRQSIRNVEQSLRTLRALIRQLETNRRPNAIQTAGQTTVTSDQSMAANGSQTMSANNSLPQNSSEDNSGPKSKKQKTENSSDESSP